MPDILDHCVRGFGLYRSPERRPDPVLRELAQTRVGWSRARALRTEFDDRDDPITEVPGGAIWPPLPRAGS